MSALNAKKVQHTGGGNRPDPLTPGTYPARIVQVLSLGMQEQPEFKGESKPPKHDLYITYELLDEFMVDEDGNDIEDKPRWISERFPLNNIESDLAKSTKRYLALDPDMEHEGDWAELAGTPCMVSITNYESKKYGTRDKVASISAMRAKEASRAPELKNPPKVFDIDDPDMEVFKSLPSWLQEVMKENLEFEGSALQEALEGGDSPKKSNKAKSKPKVEEPEDDEEEEEEEAEW